MRATVLVIAGAEFVLMLLIAGNGILSGSDPATKGLDQAAGIAAAALLVLVIVPAILLAWKQRWLPLALILALAPVVSMLAVIAWAFAS